MCDQAELHGVLRVLPEHVEGAYENGGDRPVRIHHGEADTVTTLDHAGRVDLEPDDASIPPDSGEAACHLEGGVRPRSVSEVDDQRIGCVVQGMRNRPVVDDPPVTTA